MEGGGRKEEKEGVGEGKDNQQLSRSRRMKTEAVSAGARVQIGKPVLTSLHTCKPQRKRAIRSLQLERDVLTLSALKGHGSQSPFFKIRFT